MSRRAAAKTLIPAHRICVAAVAARSSQEGDRIPASAGGSYRGLLWLFVVATRDGSRRPQVARPLDCVSSYRGHTRLTSSTLTVFDHKTHGKRQTRAQSSSQESGQFGTTNKPLASVLCLVPTDRLMRKRHRRRRLRG